MITMDKYTRYHELTRLVIRTSGELFEQQRWYSAQLYRRNIERMVWAQQKTAYDFSSLVTNLKFIYMLMSHNRTASAFVPLLKELP
jgi:ethanolamine utilization protein EutP (predicted NTPase)